MDQHAAFRLTKRTFAETVPCSVRSCLSFIDQQPDQAVSKTLVFETFRHGSCFMLRRAGPEGRGRHLPQRPTPLPMEMRCDPTALQPLRAAQVVGSQRSSVADGRVPSLL